MPRQVGSKYKKSYRSSAPPKRSRYAKPYSLSLKPYSIKQSMDYGVFEIVTGAASTDSTFTVKSKLNDFGNATSLKALYDEYRIKKIAVKIIPLQATPQQGAFGNADNPILPTLYTCVDYTDDTAIGASDILQYQDCKVDVFNATHYRSYYPKMDASSVVGTISSSGWAPTTYDTNLWYGLKGCFQNNRGVGIGIATYAVYQIIVTAYLEFRNVK